MVLCHNITVYRDFVGFSVKKCKYKANAVQEVSDINQMNKENIKNLAAEVENFKSKPDLFDNFIVVKQVNKF